MIRRGAGPEDVGCHRHRKVRRIRTRGVGGGQDRAQRSSPSTPPIRLTESNTCSERLRGVVRVDRRRRHRHTSTHRVLVGARRRGIRRRRRHQLHAADHPGRTGVHRWSWTTPPTWSTPRDPPADPRELSSPTPDSTASHSTSNVDSTPITTLRTLHLRHPQLRRSRLRVPAGISVSEQPW